MSTAGGSPTSRNGLPAESALAEEARHVRDLVFIRRLLEARGAAPEELRECDAVIADVRGRLAESARRAAARYARAA